MIQAVLKEETFETWRSTARSLMRQGIPPSEVAFFSGNELSLLPSADEKAELDPIESSLRIPAAFIELAEPVAYHRDPSKWILLYQAVWRLTHEQPHLLEILVDPLVSRLHLMKKSVDRDVHKAHAFVRFNRVEEPDGVERFVAWHRPEHPIIRRAAPFFVRRFPSMRWSILTPDGSAHWDLKELTWGAGTSESPTSSDRLQPLWKVYYASIFNPARLNLKAMQAEMPKKYWSALPEAELISPLTRQAGGRVDAMLKVTPSASEAFLPAERSLSSLREHCGQCKACDLCEISTRPVFGEGPIDAKIMLVGEQPGDVEDRTGHPFVGPAGKLLNQAMEQAGLKRESIYLTNAVKHFNWEPQGKIRLHKKPSSRHIHACRAWLDAEIDTLRPQRIVCLGATAAQSFLGPKFSLTRSRGQIFETRWSPWWMTTYHPSAVLRAKDEAQKTKMWNELVGDLSHAAASLSSPSNNA